jgi:hypothetical protein
MCKCRAVSFITRPHALQIPLPGPLGAGDVADDGDGGEEGRGLNEEDDDDDGAVDNNGLLTDRLVIGAPLDCGDTGVL